MPGDLDPDAVAWLDLAEEKYKSADGRSVPDVMGSDYPTLGREYRALERMHELAPDAVAEPLIPLRRPSDSPYRQHDVVGYYLERFDDSLPLADALEQDVIDEPGTVIGTLDDAVTTFHGHGVPHGDLRGNVYWDGRLYIIDPVGLPKDRRDETWMKTDDEQDLAHYRSIAGLD